MHTPVQAFPEDGPGVRRAACGTGRTPPRGQGRRARQVAHPAVEAALSMGALQLWEVFTGLAKRDGQTPGTLG